MAKRHRAIHYKSSLVPRCGLSAAIPCPNNSTHQFINIYNDEDLNRYNYCAPIKNRFDITYLWRA
jgi:hypothetical protein